MKRLGISVGAAAAIAVGVFVALAQAQGISVPYFTPTRLVFEGLNSEYPVNGTMDYTISVTGYGSNCIDFRSEITHESQRVAYFGEVQDCRKIEIAQGPYNYTKSFSYTGPTVLGESGDYVVEVNVIDQITEQTHTETRSFIVVEESS